VSEEVVPPQVASFPAAPRHAAVAPVEQPQVVAASVQALAREPEQVEALPPPRFAWSQPVARVAAQAAKASVWLRPRRLLRRSRRDSGSPVPGPA
jgi:hypothetical protein